MEKRKVAVVTLGDSRREFYKKRESIVASEIEKVKKVFGNKYDLYISPIVFDAEDGQNISDEIKKMGDSGCYFTCADLGHPISGISYCLWNFLPRIVVGKPATKYIQPCNTSSSWWYARSDG